MVENNFIHYTCDNIDILDETLDGKNTFHATQMAAWQRGATAVNPHNALKRLEPSTRRLTVPNVLEDLHPINITSGKSEPVFAAPVDEVWFKEPDIKEEKECVKKAQATDLALFMSCQDSDTKPSWTVFNQNISISLWRHFGYDVIVTSQGNNDVMFAFGVDFLYVCNAFVRPKVNSLRDISQFSSFWRPFCIYAD